MLLWVFTYTTLEIIPQFPNLRSRRGCTCFLNRWIRKHSRFPIENGRPFLSFTSLPIFHIEQSSFERHPLLLAFTTLGVPDCDTQAPASANTAFPKTKRRWTKMDTGTLDNLFDDASWLISGSGKFVVVILIKVFEGSRHLKDEFLWGIQSHDLNMEVYIRIPEPIAIR